MRDMAFGFLWVSLEPLRREPPFELDELVRNLSGGSLLILELLLGTLGRRPPSLGRRGTPRARASPVGFLDPLGRKEAASSSFLFHACFAF